MAATSPVTPASDVIVRPHIVGIAVFYVASYFRASLFALAASAMATVANIIADMSHVIDWVQAQIGCGLDPRSYATQQVDCLTAKNRGLLTISVTEATGLVAAIRTNALS
eukprot:8428860-Pyramimonas_sp.AAC.1